jgi:alkylated DNA repair dioxygenase AlkB
LQDDSISDEEGIKKYAEYKLEFKRQQLNEFFVTHKEEEWFKQKYHPDDSTQRKDELKVRWFKQKYPNDSSQSKDEIRVCSIAI